MTEPKILRQAKFDPKVKTYWILSPVIVLCMLIITIPLAIIYAIIARMFVNRYLANMSCSLTEHTLDIKKGVWNKTESTIPLEKITDLQLFQGPIMRFFGLHGFKVETAGQSSPAGGPLVNIIGIINTKDFRRSVLDQRDKLAAGGTQTSTAQAPRAVAGGTQATKLLAEIRDSLRRIEQKISNKAD